MKYQIEFHVIPCLSASFCVFLSISVCFSLTIPGDDALHYRDPCPSRSSAVQMHCCFSYSRVAETDIEKEQISESRSLRL